MNNFLKQYSKITKIIGITVFSILMLVNVVVTTNPNNKADIDLFGLKLSLITPSSYATSGCVHCIDLGCNGGMKQCASFECKGSPVICWRS